MKLFHEEHKTQCWRNTLKDLHDSLFTVWCDLQAQFRAHFFWTSSTLSTNPRNFMFFSYGPVPIRTTYHFCWLWHEITCTVIGEHRIIYNFLADNQWLSAIPSVLDMLSTVLTFCTVSSILKMIWRDSVCPSGLNVQRFFPLHWLFFSCLVCFVIAVTLHDHVNPKEKYVRLGSYLVLVGGVSWSTSSWMLVVMYWNIHIVDWTSWYLLSIGTIPFCFWGCGGPVPALLKENHLVLVLWWGPLSSGLGGSFCHGLLRSTT